MSPVLIVHQGALGDLLLSLPALLSLRRHHAGSPWTLAGHPVNLGLLGDRLRVRDLRSTRSRDWAALYQEPPCLPEALVRFLQKFQRVYLFAPRPAGPVAENIRKAGPAEVLWIPSFPDTLAVRSVPAVQQEALKTLGIPWVYPQVHLISGRADRSAGEVLLKGLGLEAAQGPPLWAIHPGSGSLKKNWPLENFLALAGALRQTGRAHVVFILGPVENEVQPEARPLIRRRGFPILECIDLPLLAGALSRVAGYLGNDSGVTHLASCLDLPTVALYGPTDSRLWGPIGRKTIVLQSDGAWSSWSVKAVLKECLGLLKAHD